MRHLPNALCIVRMLLAIPIAGLLSRGENADTLFVFGFAAVTDALDGFLAKRFKWESELGKILDPLADKILLVTAFVTLTVLSLVPLWLTIVVVARDVVIGFGAIAFRFVYGPVGGRPTVISKLNTLFQISYILLVVGLLAFNQASTTAIAVLTTLVLVTTIASGIDYVATYIQRALDASAKR
jgi:cardiolipin synthase (CMP-forming)